MQAHREESRGPMPAAGRMPLSLGGERVVRSGFAWSVHGWILFTLNLLAALNGALVFLGFLKAGVIGWLMMNTCAPSIALFAAGYLLRNRPVMTASAVLMLRYGFVGFFVFSWSGTNLIAQVGHFLMTLAAIYIVWEAVRQKAWRELAIGSAAGAVLLILLWLAQGAWFNAHPGLLQKLFNGEYGPAK